MGELGRRTSPSAQEYPAVCEGMVAKSEEWKRGHKWKQTEMGSIDHMDKGSVMRFHPHVMRPAGPDEVRTSIPAPPFMTETACVPLTRAPQQQPQPSPL